MKRVFDDSGDTSWWFDNGVYYRKKANGKKVSSEDGIFVGKISGQYLPDPIRAWEAKAKAAGVKMGTEESKRYRPTQATFALWEHWQNHLEGMKNADVND